MTAATDNSTGSKKSVPILRAALLAVLLVIAWLLWSGFFKALLLGLGTLSVVITLILLVRMGYFNEETFAFRYSHRLLGFWAWLGKEIVLSSIDVTRVVLRPKLDVNPTTVKLDVSDLDKVDQALLGNSITLTPGTLTLDVFEDRMLVHALTPAGREGLEKGDMHRRVAALRD